MGSDDTQSPLARAYDLVEAGRYDEARAILEPILATDFENADAWWIYAHAVTEPDLGRDALENVLRLDPNYPGAAELLRQAESMSAPKPVKAVPAAPPTMPEAPAAMPEDDFEEPEIETPAPRKRATAPAMPARAAQRRSPFPIIAVVAVIIIALVLLVLLLQQTGGGTPAATATQAVALATSTEANAVAVTEEPILSVPTEAPSVEPTLPVEQATAESTVIDYEAISAALAEFPIAESGIGVVDTSLGSTLLATACTEGGRAMRTLLPQVMNALAKQSPSLGSDIQAVGVRMLNCTENTPFAVVATDLATAQSYAAGGITDADFAASWKPQ